MVKVKPSQIFNTSLELTPLIDIIFIMIVFLLLTANTQLLSLPVDIPTSDSSAQTANIFKQNIVITLQASTPFWGINEQQFDNWQSFKTALLNKIATNPDNQQISIAAAHDSAVQPLIKLLALLNGQQVADTQILIKEPMP